MTTFRVATYNIHFGGVGRAHFISDVLSAMAVDTVVITEASDPNVIKTIADNLKMDYVLATGRKTSLAVVTRLRIISWDVFEPDEIKRPLLKATLQVSEQFHITLYGLHLQPHFFRRNEKHRVRSLEHYLDYICEQDATPHLLLGDFNAIAPGDRIEKERLPLKVKLMLSWERGQLHTDAIGSLLSAGYVDCFRTLHAHKNGFTLPPGVPNVRLDYIFADQEIGRKLSVCEVITQPSTVLQASDHYPLMAEFQF